MLTTVMMHTPVLVDLIKNCRLSTSKMLHEVMHFLLSAIQISNPFRKIDLPTCVVLLGWGTETLFHGTMCVCV
jgi:hypothetical protein